MMRSFGIHTNHRTAVICTLLILQNTLTLLHGFTYPSSSRKTTPTWVVSLRSPSSNRDSSLSLKVSDDDDDNTNIKSPFMKNNAIPSSSSSRRALISNLSSVALLTTLTSSSLPSVANAAPVLTAENADNVSARIERSRRKKPPKILRPTLSQNFAVLLMRSSYNAVDELDCVAMDQFQKDFYFIRQAEYLPYVNTLGPGLVKQGELTDPYYFDFISFAQYSTILRDITIDPAKIFEEQQPVYVGEDEPQQFITKVIQRDSSLLDDRLLPGRHNDIVGNAILDKLNQTFEGTEAAIPPLKGGRQDGREEVYKSIQQLVNLFLINGFAFNGKVTMKDGNTGTGNNASGSEFEVVFTAPATLWSGQALTLKKGSDKITNDFLLKTVKVLLQRAGYSIVPSTSSVKYTSTEEITTFTIL